MFGFRVIRGGDTVFTATAPGVKRVTGPMIVEARDPEAAKTMQTPAGQLARYRGWEHVRQTEVDTLDRVLYSVSVGIPTANGHDWVTETRLDRREAIEQIQEKSRGRADWLDAQNLVDNPGTMRLVPPGRGILSTPVKECRLVRVERV